MDVIVSQCALPQYWQNAFSKCESCVWAYLGKLLIRVDKYMAIRIICILYGFVSQFMSEIDDDGVVTVQGLGYFYVQG